MTTSMLTYLEPNPYAEIILNHKPAFDMIANVVGLLSVILKQQIILRIAGVAGGNWA